MRAFLPMIAALVLAIAQPAQAQDRFTVFAAASLKNALDAINAAWTGTGGNSAAISYAGSSALARQIEEGAPADLFISADLDWMNYLAQRDLMPSSPIVSSALPYASRHGYREVKSSAWRSAGRCSRARA